jgi:hypothetical protein
MEAAMSVRVLCCAAVILVLNCFSPAVARPSLDGQSIGDLAGQAAGAPASPARPKQFEPPLSAGKVRQYEGDYSTILDAVRAVVSQGQRELVSEERVDKQTVVFNAKYRPSFSSSRPSYHGQFRIVVEARGALRTDVRIVWPAAAAFGPGGGGEELVFGDIERRLNPRASMESDVRPDAASLPLERSPSWNRER